MKRPERKPQCDGCNKVHSRDAIIETGLEATGVCNVCKEEVLFNCLGNGKYRPQYHLPKQNPRTTVLPGQRGMYQRNFGRRG